MTRPWILIVLSACALWTASCATSPPSSRAAPPRLELPVEAARPCALPRLGAEADALDLERLYALRGAALVACDGARRLAVETLIAERALIDVWRAGAE